MGSETFHEEAWATHSPGHCTPSGPLLVPPSGQTQERVLMMWSTQVRFQSTQWDGKGGRVNLERPTGVYLENMFSCLIVEVGVYISILSVLAS